MFPSLLPLTFKCFNFVKVASIKTFLHIAYEMSRCVSDVCSIEMASGKAFILGGKVSVAYVNHFESEIGLTHCLQCTTFSAKGIATQLAEIV
jgi:hypothetical protein